MTALAQPRQSVEQTGGVPAISTHGLTKRFRGGQVAVDNLDLAVPPGSVYGFLGPNGSGKTTTIRMLLGLIAPTAGTHSLLGLSMPRHAGTVLPQVGALVEGPAFHPHLSGTDNLRRVDCADRTADPATSRARIGHALERVGLTAAARKKFRAYSLGMRQRLGIAAALLQPRALLVLDEPTNGLDPQGTREIRHLVGELAADGTTVMLSTHLLSEVEQVCTHVGVMHVGRLVADGTLAELRASTAPRVRVRTSATADAVETLKRLGLADVSVADGEVSASPGENPAEEILRRLVLDGVPVTGYEMSSADLEDVFVSLTGEGFDVSG
jgi:ABC-2 type transport system ATP-binding protein